MAKPDTTQLKNLLDTARLVSVLLPQNPTYDIVASGLACKLVLEHSGRSVVVVCPDPMTVEFNRLVGVNSVVTSLGGRNMLISFAGQTEHVDKVSYNLDKGELQLVITPKPNAPHLDPQKLQFTSGIGKFDAQLLIGVTHPDYLGPVLDQAQQHLANTPGASFTHHPPQTQFVPHQFFDPELSSLSELTAYLLDSLNYALTPDAATNLLSGMEVTTRNFQSQGVSAATFEVAGYLMRQGGVRHQVFQPDNLPPGSIPQAQPATPPPTPQTQTQTPPPDWYEPKIYQGPILP